MNGDPVDMSQTIAPKSDQLNAEDLLSGARTVTIERVGKGSAEQPVDVHLAEFPGRPFRPCKTMRRIMVAAWGPDAATYIGRRMTLYRDEAVRFGGQDVGGIRISHLSHIDKAMKVALTVTRGRRALHTVAPLPDLASRIPADLADKIAASDDREWLDKTRAYLSRYQKSEPGSVTKLQALIDKRIASVAHEGDASTTTEPTGATE